MRIESNYPTGIAASARRWTAKETGARPAAPITPSPVAGGGLVSSAAPPLRLPGAHFAAALGFWLLGAAGLVWVAPDVANGLFPLPRVVLVAHLFTLGWITTTILGALYQFLPVALREPIRSERLAHASFALYVPGLVCFLWGLVTGWQAATVAGAAIFGSGLLLFVGNLAATLARCRERGLTWWALAGAAFFLLVTVVLGAVLTGNLRWHFLTADHRFLALGVHIHVAVAGWVMLVMVGVAHRLLPMFLLSHGAPEWPGKLSAGLLAAGTALLLAAHHLEGAGVFWLVAALLAGGLLAFLVQAALFFRNRKKPTLDPGLRLAGVGLGFLGFALLLAPAVLIHGVGAPRLATAYVVALILGGFSLFVAGFYYKILPFLIWFHRFGPRVGKQPVPRVSDLYAAAPATVAAVLLGGGVAGLVLATLSGAAWAARPAALVFAAGATTLAVQMLLIALRRPA